MVYETDHSICTVSVPPKKNLINSTVLWFAGVRKRYVEKQNLNTLLSGKNRTLEDIGLSRPDLVNELGYDPRELERMRAGLAYPNPYLWNVSAMNSDHTKSHQ